MEARRDGPGMSGALDWALKEPRHKDVVLHDEIPGMSGVWDWALKETPRGGLRRTSDELGSCLWLWTGSSQGMREPGSLKERDIIGAERKCVPNG